MSHLTKRLAAAALTAVLVAVMVLTLQAASARSQDPPSTTPTTPTEPSPQPEPCRPAPWAKYKKVVRHAWRYHVVSVGDYRAGPRPGVRKRERIKRMRVRCTSDKRHRKMFRYMVARRHEWRFHRHIDAITPYGEWAIPSYVVGCETGHTYSYTIWNRGSSSPDRASGAYQIQGPTWRAYGGLRYAQYAAYAPPWAQHKIAHRILRGQGPNAWSCW